jgi:hypothetical protein
MHLRSMVPRFSRLMWLSPSGNRGAWLARIAKMQGSSSMQLQASKKRPE